MKAVKRAVWDKAMIKRLEEYLKSADDLDALKRKIAADKFMPSWGACRNKMTKCLSKLFDEVRRKNYLDRFFADKNNVGKFKELYTGDDPDRVQKIKESFSDFDLKNDDRIRSIVRRMGLEVGKRNRHGNWVKEWINTKTEEVDLFKRLYSDHRVSVDDILAKFPIFKGDRNRVSRVASRLGVMRSSKNQHIKRDGNMDATEAIDSIVTRKLLVNLLRKKPMTVDEISAKLNISKENVYRVAQEAIDRGYSIVLDEQARKFSLFIDNRKNHFTPSEPIKVYRKSVRIGIVGSTKIGDINQQMSLLHTIYSVFERDRIDFAIHTGDLVAGVYPKSKRQNLFLPELDDQIDYVVNHYPRTKKFKTHIVGGLAEVSFRAEGINDPLGIICSERSDLRSRGYGHDDFVIKGKVVLRVVHPLKKGLGNPYARSYKPQKAAKNIIATTINMKDATINVPQMVFVGRWRASLYIPSQEGIPVVSIPALSASTIEDEDFVPDIGAIIVELFFDSNNQLDKDRPPIIHDLDLAAYVKKDDYLYRAEEMRGWDKMMDTEKSFLRILEESTWGNKSIGELSRRIKKTGVSEKTVIDIYDKLRSKGIKFSVTDINGSIQQIGWQRPLKDVFGPLDIGDIFVDRIRVGMISDTHLCSNEQQLSLLKKSYEIAAKEGVDCMLHAGDITDGPGEIHGRAQNKCGEVFVDGATNQWMYCVKNYPVINGLDTIWIAGNHDGWWMNAGRGFDVGDAISRLRPDIKHHGFEALVERKGFSFYLNHPDGGPSRALSYKAQWYVESKVKEMMAKSGKIPNVMMLGNWHVAFYFNHMGIAAFCVPCLQEQTLYMKRKGLIPDIGMWVVEIVKDRDGRVTKSAIRYYDFRSMTKEKDF